MQSKAATVEAYVESLPEDRREAVNALRRVFSKNMDPLLKEVMNYGMIGYVVPHAVYPAGYHCDPKLPLPYAAIASQKAHLSIYLMGLYVDGSRKDVGADGLTPEARWFQEAWLKTGKKLDMGKACVRVKRLDDVPLEVLADTLRRVPVKTYIDRYEAALGTGKAAEAGSKARPAASKKVAKASTAKKKVAAKKSIAAATRRGR